MPLPEWKSEYSVGNKTLDDQHKVILEICARIHNLSESDPDYLDKLHIALYDMNGYASQHFKDEERILSHIDYSALELHRVEHDNFHHKLLDLLMEAMEGTPDAAKMSKFLQDWWVDHILNSDMKYKPYLEPQP